MDVTGTDGETKDLDSLHEKKNVPVAIKVLLFARARDLTGLTDMPLEVSSGSTAHDCLNKLIAKFPQLNEICDCIVLALNEEYTTEFTTAKDRDELANTSNKRWLILFMIIPFLFHV